MNRWTGTGHLTKDPKFLETENGTAICTLRDRGQARRQAGPRRLLRRQVLRRPGVGVRAVPQGRARGRRRRPAAVRRVPDPGRRLRLARLHRRRARRVPRQPQGLQRSGQRRGLPRSARHGRRGARGPPGRLTTIAGPRRSTGRGPDDFHGDRHDHHDHSPATRPPHGSSPRSPARRTAASCSSCATASMTGSGWARSSTAPTGCADWRPARSCSAGAPTSTSAARRARAGTAAATPSTRAFVLWADCDGEDAVAALERLRAGAVDRDRVGHRLELPRLLAAHRAARARRGRAREPASRARARRRPRVRRRRADPARPRDAARTSTTRRRRSTRSGSTPTGASTRLTSSGRCPTRRRAPARAPIVPAEHRGDDPLLAIAPDVYVRRLLGVEVPRHRKVPCPFHEDRHASLHVYETAERGWYCFGACRRGGTIYDLAAPLYGYTARGEDFLRLRAELRRLFGLEAA